MATTQNYSAFFSSGLLAPPLHISTTNIISYPTTPTTDDGTEEISRLSGVINPTPPTTATTPRVRRRRSSLASDMTPLGAIKSPTKSAGFAWQASWGRSRERSGSLGNLDTNVQQERQSRRAPRANKAIRLAGPLSAPPEAPLPPLPIVSSVCSSPTIPLFSPISPQYLTPFSAPPTIANLGPKGRPKLRLELESFREGDSFEEQRDGNDDMIVEPGTSPILGDL